MARKKEKNPAERFADEVRRALIELCAPEGYIAFGHVGPYDHNPYDVPLPTADYPRVFTALHAAVDYAQTMKGWDKVKIALVDGRVVPGTKTLASKIVWRSWVPGEPGGWAPKDEHGLRRRS